MTFSRYLTLIRQSVSLRTLMATFLIGSYIARLMVFSNQPLFLICWRHTIPLPCAHCISKFQKTHQCTSQHATWNHWSWGIQRSDGHLGFSIATIDSAHWVSEVCVRQVCPSNTRGTAITQILPWFASVSEQLLYFKRQRRKTERRWLKSGLTVDRQLSLLQTEATSYPALAAGKDGVLQCQTLYWCNIQRALPECQHSTQKG